MNILRRLFSTKYSILESGILNGMTDIHTHILPGVDDGISDNLSARKALTYLENLGVSRVFATPHVMSDFQANTSESLSGHFQRFLAEVPSSISMKLCAEYMLDVNFRTHLDQGLLSYDGKHVLIETSYMAPPLGFKELLNDIRNHGYVPVIAHPERYVYMETEDYLELKSMNCLFQLNLISLGGAYGSHALHFSDFLLEHELYSFVGSDFHGIRFYDEILRRQILTNKQIEKIMHLLSCNTALWDGCV